MRLRLLLRLLCLWALFALSVGAATAPVRPIQFRLTLRDGYSVRYELSPHPETSPRSLDIALTFHVEDKPKRVSVQMPVWSPGDYHVQNHAKYVQNLKAFAVNT